MPTPSPARSHTNPAERNDKRFHNTTPPWLLCPRVFSPGSASQPMEGLHATWSSCTEGTLPRDPQPQRKTASLGSGSFSIISFVSVGSSCLRPPRPRQEGRR